MIILIRYYFVYICVCLYSSLVIFFILFFKIKKLFSLLYKTTLVVFNSIHACPSSDQASTLVQYTWTQSFILPTINIKPDLTSGLIKDLGDSGFWTGFK